MIRAERAESVSVLASRYGYSASGDNSDFIQTAINKASKAGGGEVYLQGGTWNIANRLLIPSHVRLRGAGKWITTLNVIPGGDIITGHDSVGGNSVICGGESGNSAHNVELSDFGLMCNADQSFVPAQNGGFGISSMIDFRDGYWINVRNVAVYRGWGYHIGLYVCSLIEVTGCSAYPGTSGKFLYGLDGIHLWQSTQARVVNNEVNQEWGGTHWTDGDDAIVAHVFAAGGVAGDIVIANNTVQGGDAGTGIDLANGPGTIENVSITGNTCYQSKNGAIKNQWFGTPPYSGITRGIAIVGNTIRDCGNNPIWIGGGAWSNATTYNYIVTGNVADNPGGAKLTASVAFYGSSNDHNIVVANNNPPASISTS